jgi:hypothetical protein
VNQMSRGFYDWFIFLFLSNVNYLTLIFTVDEGENVSSRKTK